MLQSLTFTESTLFFAFIFVFVLVWMTITLLKLMAKNSKLNHEINKAVIKEQEMIDDLKHCYSAIQNSTEDFLSNNPDGKFNWRIKTNRTILNTLRENYYPKK